MHALKDYTDTYIKGCTPPSSTTWKDPDNNVAFHRRDHRDDAQLHDLDRGQMARRMKTTRR